MARHQGTKGRHAKSGARTTAHSHRDVAVANHVIHGRVVEKQTGRGITGLRIEAFDKDQRFDDLVASAITDADGWFTMQFDQSRFREHAPEVRPDLYFKAWRGDQLIHSTENAVLWNVESPELPVIIEVDAATTPDVQTLVVRGTVRSPDGSAVSRATVAAADAGLRSETSLGRVLTGADGAYSIRYHRDQLRPEGKQAADLIVRAFDEAGHELAHSNRVCHAPAEAVVDLVVGNRVLEGPSEYDTLIAKIHPYLGETALADLERDDVQFLACSAEVDRLQVATLTVASRLARDTSLPEWLFYAMGRQRVRLQLEAIALLRRKTWKDALTAAMAAHVVPLASDDVVELLLERLQTVVSRTAFDESRSGFSIGAVLATSLVGRDLQEAFLASYVNRATSPDDFWKSLEDDPRLSREAIDDFRLTLVLARLTAYRLPVLRQLKQLRERGEVRMLRDLATLDRARWREMMHAAADGDGFDLPADTPGDTPEDRLEHYITNVRASIESLFPSDSLRRSLTAAPETDDDLRQLLANTPDLDLYWTNIDAYLGEHRETALSNIAVGQRDTVVARVKRIQRLLRLTGRSDQVRVLDAAGFDSAVAIARTPKQRFTRRFVATAEQMKDTLDDVFVVNISAVDAVGHESSVKTLMMMNSSATPSAVADAIYLSAVSKSTLHLEQYVNLKAGFDVWPGAIGGEEDSQRKLKEDALKGVPDLATLFGSQSFCECGHCRSVYSPAAYLVDLLHELDDLFRKGGELLYKDAAKAPAPIGALLKRRPDIGRIPLTCENTNTLLPYIDLVNEALESYIESHLDASGDWTDSVPSAVPTIAAHDTGKTTADELRAVPQYVVPKVYKTLARKAVYPMTLPFDRSLEVTRAYLGHLGASRADLIRTFAGTKPVPAIEAALAIEQLGTCPAQYQIIAGTSNGWPFDETDGAKKVWSYYGYDEAKDLTALLKVPELLRRTGLKLENLVAALKTRFINPFLDPNVIVAAKPVEIAFPAQPGADACDVSGMTLVNVPEDDGRLVWFDRLQRFIRLWRAVGWDIADVDRAITAVGNTIDDTGLQKLAALKMLGDTVDQQPALLLALWADLDTWAVKPDESFYARALLNRSIVQDETTRKAFEKVLSAGQSGTIAMHASGIAAAFALTGDDIERIRDDSGLEAGNEPLTLAALSTLYRYATLSRALGMRVRDLITLRRLLPTPMRPFASMDPRPTLAFVQMARRIDASGFSIPLLNYLFRNELEPTRHPAPTREFVKATLEGLQRGLAAIHQEVSAAGQQPPPESLRARLEMAATLLENPITLPDGVDKALAVLDPRQQTFQATPLAIGDRITFVKQHFTEFLPQPDAALFGTPLPDPKDAKAEQRFFDNVEAVLDALVPWLRRRLQESLVIERTAEAMEVEPAVMKRLLTDLIDTTQIAAPVKSALDYLFGLVDENGNSVGLQLEHVTPQPPTLILLRLFKAAAYVNGFEMTDQELDVFTNPKTSPLRDDSGAVTLVLKLNDLPLTGVAPISSTQPGELFDIWRALRAFYELREALPRSEKTLVDYFGAIDADRPAVLAEATGWNASQIQNVNTGLGAQALPHTVAGLVRLHEAVAMVTRVGASPKQMFSWAANSPTHEQADAVVQAVKARYERGRWLEVARGLNDPLRERQRDALVAYLIPKVSGAQTPNELFEYFLIDVEMNSCMRTSRIKQAISSVQLFVQRCLLNLEKDVSPDAIDSDRWEWMKHYRIWEANRKVFLYPENYTLPELRDDKTPLFTDLETELLQNELTDEMIETAAANYLYKLDEVARLDIRGLCREQADGDEICHVFGRTWNSPHVYYYRRGVFKNGTASGEWDAWERLDFDIDSDHLVPVVWNRRLFVFWALFKEVRRDRYQEGVPVGEAGPFVDWRIQLAWSECRQTDWSSVQKSKGAVQSKHFWLNHTGTTYKKVYSLLFPSPEAHYFKAMADADSLTVDVFRRWNEHSNKNLYVPAGVFAEGGGGVSDDGTERIGRFVIRGCGGDVVIHEETIDLGYLSLKTPQATINHSMEFRSTPQASGLVFQNSEKTTVLSGGADYAVLPDPQLQNPGELYYPFMFEDGERTYFARPVVKLTNALEGNLIAADGGGAGAMKELNALEIGLDMDLLGPDESQQLAGIGVPVVNV